MAGVTEYGNVVKLDAYLFFSCFFLPSSSNRSTYISVLDIQPFSQLQRLFSGETKAIKPRVKVRFHCSSYMSLYVCMVAWIFMPSQPVWLYQGEHFMFEEEWEKDEVEWMRKTQLRKR